MNLDIKSRRVGSSQREESDETPRKNTFVYAIGACMTLTRSAPRIDLMGSDFFFTDIGIG